MLRKSNASIVGFLVVGVLCSLFLISCSKESSTTPSTKNDPPVPSDSYALPFTETFESSDGEIMARWYWIENVPAGTLPWQLEKQDKANGAQSIRTPRLNSGWSCAQSLQVCWNGQRLRTKKPIDLTGKSAAQLTFANKRITTPLASAPGCWLSLTTDNEIRFCVLWGTTTNAADMSILQSYTSERSQWGVETISLNSLVGKKIYIGFRQVAHCTEWGYYSASWLIDDIIITGN